MTDTAKKSLSASPKTQPTDAKTEMIETPASLRETYRFERILGYGSQAKVYLATRLSDQKKVVAKQLNVGSVKTWKSYELFHREANVLASLNIKGVAHFYDAIDCLDDDPPCSYIVQEYIPGQSLAEMIKAGHRFQLNEVYDIIIQMLKILKQLHRMTPPVIHRDIKPSNIMIEPQSNGCKVTLIDFGAVANPQVQSGGSTVAGTYGYMPPEQLMGRPIPGSDIYALAAVSVELFCGKSPATLPCKDFRLMFEPEMEQTHKPELISILRRMLDPDIMLRMTDTDDLIRIFEQFKKGDYQIDILKSDGTDTDKNYNRQLKEVQCIGEDGNMNLWQHLSDQTPRAIPQMVDVLFIKENANITLKKYELKPVLDKKATISSNLRPFFKRYTIPLIISVVLFIYFFDSSHLTGLIWWSMIMFFFWLILYKTDYSVINKVYDSKYYYQPLQRNSQFDTSQLLKIVRSGRKTVATITRIEYREDHDNIIINQNDSLFINEQPRFVISYKFNPPDDVREEDLIHQYICHEAPEGHYAVGDQIPILYTITRLYSTEQVLSIPFPFPMYDATPDELIGSSEAVYR
ncbi:MAG: serine/threonine protein kinase [Proteobacteria bacterium]|nr:serine/threonine protein kinase [Pseudomonadota bacterium]